MKCFRVTQNLIIYLSKKDPDHLSHNKPIHLQSLGMTNTNDLACTSGVQKQPGRRFFLSLQAASS